MIDAERRRWRLWGIHVSALMVALALVTRLGNLPIAAVYLVWVGVFIGHTALLVRANAHDTGNSRNLDE